MNVKHSLWVLAIKRLNLKCYLLLSVQAFILTFLAEWGDRSQIATIAVRYSYSLLIVSRKKLSATFIITCSLMSLQFNSQS